MAVPAQRAAALGCSAVQLNCALHRRLWLCCWFVLLFEVIQFVANCLCWTALSAGLASVADLTLSSIGYMAELAGKAAWCCMVLEMGKSGRAPVSEWVVKNRLCY